jgi:shikimate 5-dehydrogenase
VSYHPWLRDILAQDACAYDMAYGKADLPFLTWAKTQQATISDGLGMLIEQAAESFFIWRGHDYELQNSPAPQYVHVR